MLKLLVDYTHRHVPGSEPGFTTKTVKWALAFSDTGDQVAVIPLGASDSGRVVGMAFGRCPDLSQPEMKAGGITKSHFLVDTADVVALLGDAADDPKTLAKHAYFVKLLRDAVVSMPELGRISQALSDPRMLEQIQVRLSEQRAKPSDKVTVRLGDCFPLVSDAWHDWWRCFRASIAMGQGKRAGSAVSFVSGQAVVPAPTHPKVSGLADVGGSSMGAPLIGFDKEAFTSYGLQQSANCAVSAEDATAYRDALNDLLAKHSQRLAGARVAHWFKEDVPPEDDPVAWLYEPPDADDEKARDRQELAAQRRVTEMLAAIREGRRPDLARNRYYAITLSGAAGRVMIRDWMEGQFGDLAGNILAWFDDLTIAHRDGGNALAKDPKFLAVLAGTVRDLDDLAAPMVARMWRTAVRAEPMPRAAAAQAIARVRADVIADAVPNHARMALLKAYLLRNYRSKGEHEMADELKPFLNEDHSCPAYHCGRLMAVYAAIQRAALGDVGAGVVQRYYAAASATPALVLGRLARSSQFHLNKIESGGLAYWYEQKLASIWQRLGDGAPRTLDLEEQSLFALGYYQQLADLRTKKGTEDVPTTNDNTEGEN